ncbi:Arginine--tRNA ligase, cytoplasmic [Camellia lanceoleosa]|uniref:Arginine--tRNA ligase, cytoplasmic n=1 Tax=Camellia lanceoleosa TaxID=1840588 RepID=A0ACC0IVR5_9ERIC|nr:Arginine--tRNA ligase, cytoplasmic [Camellia lanceoleosa]
MAPSVSPSTPALPAASSSGSSSTSPASSTLFAPSSPSSTAATSPSSASSTTPFSSSCPSSGSNSLNFFKFLPFSLPPLFTLLFMATDFGLPLVGVMELGLGASIRFSMLPFSCCFLISMSRCIFGGESNNAMSLWTKIKGKGSELIGPQPIGKAIMNNLPKSEMVDKCSIAGTRFVNVVLSKDWIAKSIQKMLINGVETRSPKLTVKRAVVDFSSPNIAKEMHVSHLRSTIIRDTLARMLEFSNVEVLWRNHVGDWGTQFGMLIEFLFEKFPNVEFVNDQAIGDLEAFYKASKQRLDSDPGFKERAQQEVVSLQAWAQICEINRRGYQRVYQRLGIKIEEKGESFYNPYIPGVLEELDKQGLIEESEGAHMIFIEGKNIPLIVVKKDGGFNYASTDLVALWYRLNEEKAEWIIYVIDVGKADKWTAEELDQTAEAVGYGAVK